MSYTKWGNRLNKVVFGCSHFPFFAVYYCILVRKKQDIKIQNIVPFLFNVSAHGCPRDLKTFVSRPSLHPWTFVISLLTQEGKFAILFFKMANFPRCPKNGKFPKVSQKLLTMGNTILLISSSNYAKHHINVCSGGDLCSPFISNISETPCVKVGFDVRIFFVWWMRAVFSKVEDSIFFCLPRLYFCLRKQPFSHTKSKASAYE